jgi:hypothetical protein
MPTYEAWTIAPDCSERYVGLVDGETENEAAAAADELYSHGNPSGLHLREQRSQAPLTGYLRETDGTLEPVALLRDGDGDLTDLHGYPLERTDETAELLGWGDTDELTRASVWRNDGGREILVPEVVSCP